MPSKEQTPETNVIPQKSFNYSELTEIVAKAVASAQIQLASTLAQQGDQNAKVLAEALRESKTPYVDPKHIENEKMMRDQMRETERRKRAAKRAEQEACPHLQGSSPESATTLPYSSFAVHVLDSSEVIGICTNCQKIISSRRPEDLRWFKVKSTNVRSAAGQRTFYDNQIAIKSRQMMDDELGTAIPDVTSVEGE